ncbi:MAG: autotransporter outer membrane beta-barrel domain-containing protein [Puniceicoccales bacterium]|jgi:outer membrane autotransporter protein|nr:autotransporter outer membrane beta-barrel domain-containing protein [Puniceicoccales bacterium]
MVRIAVVVVCIVLFFKNVLLGSPNCDISPEEAIDLISKYNSVEEMLDAQLADPALQERFEFGRFIRSLRGRNFENEQAFTDALGEWWHIFTPNDVPSEQTSSLEEDEGPNQRLDAHLIEDNESEEMEQVSLQNENMPIEDMFFDYDFFFLNANESLESLPNASSDETEYVVTHVNAELASLTVAANTIFANAISDRIVSVKGCLADPFIHIIYGHAHQDEIAELGYNSNMGGFVIGLDDVWTFTNERYLRLGAALGYASGKTTFFGSATGLAKSAKHDICTLELFGAYESFNDKHLKTNVGITFGYSHSKDTLYRMNLSHNIFDAKLRADSIFFGVELVKNLYAYKGYQFGLWFRVNYSHVVQRGYDESTTAAVGAQHVSSVNHDFITTVAGFNIEKEIIDSKHVDKKLILSLKTGWECQAMRKYSNATVVFDNNLGIGEFVSTVGQPSKNAAIMSLGVSKKLNVHWSIVGSYVVRLNKDISTHNAACGIEYSF